MIRPRESSSSSSSLWDSPAALAAVVVSSFSLGILVTSSYCCYFYSRKRDDDFGQDYENHIGELPQHARHIILRDYWPWDRILRRRRTKDTATTTTNTGSKSTDTASTTSTNKKEKSDLCIGDIFGLDVGGTLAKLVYFERRDLSKTSAFQRSNPRRRSSTTEIVLPQNHQEQEPVLEDHALNHSFSSFSKPSAQHPPHHFHTTESLDHIKTTQQDVLRPKHPHSESMLDLSQRQAEALTRFYQFAHTLDSSRTMDQEQQHQSHASTIRDEKLTLYSKQLGGDLHFLKFETRKMKDAMRLLREHGLHYNIHEIGATGGGAHKFADLWQDELGITMKKQQELTSLVAGMQFILSTVVGECYTYRPRHHHHEGGLFASNSTSSVASLETSSGASEPDGTTSKDKVTDKTDVESTEDRDTNGADEWWWSRKVQRDAISYSSSYPYLLVTIGTGVSILRVDGPRKHERISGSTIGGGTYLGLIRLLTDFEDYEDIMRLAENGDPSKVDMLVGDIYGDNQNALEKLGLPANLVASSFGKLTTMDNPAEGIKKEDLARALLLMVTNNIGQVAYLNARLCKTSRIYFVGNFLRGNKLSQRRLAYAIDYWSKGEMEALFLEHEGYFGALGAFLLSQGIANSEEHPNHWKSEVSASSDGEGHRRSRTFHNLNPSSKEENRDFS